MIPLFKPSFGRQELRAVKNVLDSGWAGLGPKTKEFEDEFARYIGTRYAIAMNSGSAALHLALMLLDIKGKEVISPSLTFVSANHAILLNGAIPVFADVRHDTLTIDPEDVARKITKRTIAIIVMHYGGHPCQMEQILNIAGKKRITVIEDAAHACGAQYKNKKIGTFGRLSCFSFHAVKNLTTGEGGMITTPDKRFDQRLRRLRWVGISKGGWCRSRQNTKHFWYYNVEELGYKYHMSDINAAIGLAQLKKLDGLNQKRREIFNVYNSALGSLSWLQVPVVKGDVSCAHHNYVVKVENRDNFMQYLRKRGIATGVHYIPSHLFPLYRKFRAKLPVTETVWKRIVTLPFFPDLTKKQIDYIITSIKEYKK